MLDFMEIASERIIVKIFFICLEILKKWSHDFFDELGKDRPILKLDGGYVQSQNAQNKVQTNMYVMDADFALIYRF